MPNNPIPVIEACGTHREVGIEIGSRCTKLIQDRFASRRNRLPVGATWEKMLEQSQLYLAASRYVYPQYLEELEGIAEGAQVPFEEVFLSRCEELWDASAWRGCTDMAARGRATADGSTLIAHRNDLLPLQAARLVILKVKA